LSGEDFLLAAGAALPGLIMGAILGWFFRSAVIAVLLAALTADLGFHAWAILDSDRPGELVAWMPISLVAFGFYSVVSATISVAVVHRFKKKDKPHLVSADENPPAQ
jgi:hypothetical protein